MDQATDNGLTLEARRRLPEADGRALRDALLSAVDTGEPLNACGPAIERVCAAAHGAGLSVTDLIVEVKLAWSAIPASRRARHQRPGGAAEQIVSRCIEGYYAATE